MTNLGTLRSGHLRCGVSLSPSGPRGLHGCPEAGQDGRVLDEERLTAERQLHEAPALEAMRFLAVVTPWILAQLRSTPPEHRLCRRSSS